MNKRLNQWVYVLMDGLLAGRIAKWRDGLLIWMEN